MQRNNFYITKKQNITNIDKNPGSKYLTTNKK